MKPRNDNEDDLFFKPNGELYTIEDQDREFDEMMDEMESLIEEHEGKEEKG